MCRLRNIAMCDYQESVTTGRTDRHTPCHCCSIVDINRSMESTMVIQSALEGSASLVSFSSPEFTSGPFGFVISHLSLP